MKIHALTTGAVRVKHSFLFPRPGPRRQLDLFLPGAFSDPLPIHCWAIEHDGAAGSRQLLQREHPQSEPAAAGDRQPRAVHDHRLRRPRGIAADLQLLHGRARVSQRVRVDELPTGDAGCRTAVPLERLHLDGQRAAVRHDDRAGRLRCHGCEPDADRRDTGDGDRSERLGDRLVAG